MKKKISIIGLGPMGHRYIKAISKINTAILTSVCDKDPLKLQLVNNKLKKYSNYKKMIISEGIDLLIISSTAVTHSEMVIFASNAGVKKIICEKPIATSLKDAKKMIDVCSTNKTKLTINHTRRWYEAYINLKKMISKGILGKIRNITVEMAGGQLGSNGGHHWDLIRFLTDLEFKKVSGTIDKTGTKNPRGHIYRDPGAYGLLLLENNLRVHFDMSEDFGTPFFMKITCEYGRVTIDEKSNKFEIYTRIESDRKKSFYQRPKLEKVFFKPKKTSIIEACALAIKEILSNKNSSCNGIDGYKSLEVTVGIYKSFSVNKKFVNLSLNKSQINKRYKFA